MNTYCLSCKKDTRNINPKVTYQDVLFAIIKKSTFILQGSGWLDSLGLNTPQNRMRNALWNAFN